MIIPQKMTARLSEKQTLNDRFGWYRFELDPGYQLHNLAGQYAMLEVAPGTMRAYSMCDRPDVDSSFELLIDHAPAGVGVRFLQGLHFGDTVKVLEPLGQLTIQDDQPEAVVLLATGSGISPFKAIITDELQIKNSPRPLYLLWSMNYASEFFYLEDLLDLQTKYPQFHFFPVVTYPDASWQLDRGYVTDVLARLNLPSQTHYYLCGSPAMIKASQQWLTARQVPPQLITTEQFGTDASNKNTQS